MSEQRERFEAYIIDWCESSGIEHSLESHPLNPDSYEEYAIQLAWQSWQSACPEGWQCVPSNGTTEPMDDAARGFLLMLSMRSDISYERLREELTMRGETDLINALPEYAQTGAGHIPKAAQADILFRLMCSAAPRPEDV